MTNNQIHLFLYSLYLQGPLTNRLKYKEIYHDTFKLYEYFTNNPLSLQHYTIQELKEILRPWISKN